MTASPASSLPPVWFDYGEARIDSVLVEDGAGGLGMVDVVLRGDVWHLSRDDRARIVACLARELGVDDFPAAATARD